MKAAFIVELDVPPSAEPHDLKQRVAAALKGVGLTGVIKGPSLHRENVSNPTIYCDGGNSRKHKIGAWAYVLLMPDCEAVEASGVIEGASNNVAELSALLEALRAIPTPSVITAYTDSQYVQKGFMYYTDGWIRDDWRKSDGNKVANVDLWKALLVEKERHEVDVRWVKGHSGNPFNERCDFLCGQAMLEHRMK